MADGCTSTNKTLRLARPLLQDYAWLAARMRACEIEHFLALSGLHEFSADAAARAFAMTSGPAFALVGEENLPIMAGGFVPERAGVFEAWLLGTDEAWDRYGHRITRVCNRQITALLAHGAHRIHVLCLPNNTRAHAWYQRGLRMQFEGTLKGYAASGADMLIFARTR